MTRRLRKKYKRRFLFITITVLLVLAVVTYFMFFKKEKYVNEIVIEIGQPIPTAKDYLLTAKNKVVWDKKISKKTVKIGKYKGTIKVGVKKYNVTLVVSDTTSPIITGYKDITIYKNDKIDLLENIIVTDNSRESIKAVVKGDYDISKKGKYELSYEACDSSKNCSSEDFVLEIKEKQVSNDNNNKVVIKENNDVTMKYVDGVLIVNKSFPLPANYVPNNLVSAGGSAKAIDYVVEAFNELKKDASAEGLNIYASTAYRSYGFQKTLYTNYVARDGKEEADTYSARPGYSEHQTGLAIDCNTVNSSFTNTAEGIWLNENAWKYGFTIRFPKGKQKETGYMYESWHIRYVGKELAKTLYNNGSWISLEEYFNLPSEYED